MSLSSAFEDFHKAHRKADLEEILAFLTGKSTNLLSYNEILEKLHERSRENAGLQNIPLDAIIGSVGRYRDFNRSFLPRSANIDERWARVKVAMNSFRKLPPIDVYQIGNYYFVLDGNHRVSVAREMGQKEIQAYVTVIKTRVPLTSETSPDNLILMAEKADFLEESQLDTLRPEADLNLTAPGMYNRLLEHIKIHHYFMGIDQQKDIPFQDAVNHWFEFVYTPMMELIQRLGILRDFQNRTEADMYLWIMEYQASLVKELGWQIEHVDAANSLVDRFSNRTRWGFRKFWDWLIDMITFGLFEAGPKPGEWRLRYEKREAEQQKQNLFKSILVPVRGEQSSWEAVDQAVIVAKRENSKIFGLHVVPTQEQCCDEAAENLKQAFHDYCASAGIAGTLAIEVGSVTSHIVDRTRWSDLVSLKMEFPPDSQPISKLRSGIHTLIQRSGRPILVVPDQPTPLINAILAFDGSPKAMEALYLAAYFSILWETQVSVVSVLSHQTDQQTQDYAREYFQARNIRATYLIEEGPNAEGILRAARKQASDFIIMGSYGFNPLMEVVLGSTVDQLLLKTSIPVLICR